MWRARAGIQWKQLRWMRDSVNRWVAVYVLIAAMVIIIAAFLGTKILLSLFICLGAFLFIVRLKESIFTLKPIQKVPLMLDEGDTFVSGSLIKNRNIQKNFRTWSSIFDAKTRFTYILVLAGLCISLGLEIVYVRDFLDGSDYERMNTVFKFSMQAWLYFAIGGAFASISLLDCWMCLMLGSSIFLLEEISRIQDHQNWIAAQPPVQSAKYTPTLNGLAFIQAWYPGDAKAISWLNENIAGSPVILEAAAPVSYQWFNRVSIYTGLPDVLGWIDHVEEQRYSDQPLNRVTDIGIIYTTPDEIQAITLLRYYHVRYIYVGDLERQAYAQQSTAGLDKFDRMVGDTLRRVYRTQGVTIYEVL